MIGILTTKPIVKGNQISKLGHDGLSCDVDHLEESYVSYHIGVIISDLRF